MQEITVFIAKQVPVDTFVIDKWLYPLLAIDFLNQ